jgi:hypothetical protein
LLPLRTAPWPELASEVSDDDFRDFLPVGSPFSARHVVDAIEASGLVAEEVSAASAALCRREAPFGAIVGYRDDFETVARVRVWVYRDSHEPLLDWAAEAEGEPDQVALVAPDCTSAALIAPRVAGNTFIAANLVVSIETFSAETRRMLVEAVRSLAAEPD